MQRTLPGILLAAGWVILLLFGSPLLFHFMVFVIVVIGAMEYLKMIFKEGLNIPRRVYLITTLTLPVVFCWPDSSSGSALFGLYVSVFLTILYFIRCYTQYDNAYERFSKVVFGSVYVGVLAAYLVMLRFLPQGGAWLVVLSAVTAGSDSGAYYFGSHFGRRKLCESISPKKTIEGALGGLLCGISAALLLAWLLLDGVNLFMVGAFSIVLTGVGILGDLAESIIKRGTQTKDSGSLLAGHGGVLDRVDSLLLAAPVLYYLLIL